ncbi:MAG: hypothetical protein A4E61_01948 [Syntrophorhabdus sp. PtaB.Bin184]|nr:MAG: hypothetical protein A4E61_01948 [Syntrophorhabdus sp. PtaB.Bin184]
MSELPLAVYLFALFSLVGWVLEVCFRSARQKKLVNPGFLAGPYLPLYGASVLALTCCIIHLNKGLLEPFVADLIDNAMPPVGDWGRLLIAAGALILSKAVLYFFVTTGMELVTGLASRRLLNRQLWDYSGEVFCIGNSVCLKFSCLWVALAFFYEYVAFPAALSLGRSLDPVLLLALGLGVCLAMFFDFCLQANKVVKTRRILSVAGTEENHREFSKIVRPLLEKEELRRLAHFRHHWNKTRLDHSMDVAWLSYVITKRLSRDYVSAARGGLLHDLFHYDWATEGPRLHGLRHPRICLGNAEKIVDLNSRERDIIKKHMWPLTIMPPRYPEAWCVCLADTYCGVRDYLDAARRLRRTSNEGCVQSRL